MNNRLIFAVRSITASTLTAGCCLLALTCAFDTNVPLENTPPVNLSASSIEKTLTVPDSVVCTLSVRDENELHLSVQIPVCSLVAADGSVSPAGDSFMRAIAEHDIRELSADYGIKTYQILFTAPHLGTYRGRLSFVDASGSRAGVDFTISKIFADAFDEEDLQHELWRRYDDGNADSTAIAVRNGCLRFQGVADAASAGNGKKIGIRSSVAFGGDFHMRIGYNFPEGAPNGRMAMVVSTSSDTGEWSNKRAGIYLVDAKDHLSVEFRSVKMQTSRTVTTWRSGIFGIARHDSTLQFMFGTDTVTTVPGAMSFPKDLPVYLHLQLIIEDAKIGGLCTWDNLRVSDAVLLY